MSVPTAVRAVRAARVPVALAALAVLLQVAYPLVDGEARDRLTVATVLVFCAASVSHAAVWRGIGWAGAYFAVSAGFGLLAESVGTATGVPFGEYAYADSLGASLLGVPVVVPLAWAMFAYPCLLVGQRLAATPLGATLVGGWALASWDLFLDPQMVAAGHWTWTDVQVSLPGAPEIPVSNHLGWVVVAVLMIGLLQLLPRRPHPAAASHPADLRLLAARAGASGATGRRSVPIQGGASAPDDRVPAALFLWTYASSVLAFAVFFGRPVVALVGGIGMGLVAVPYALSLRHP